MRRFVLFFAGVCLATASLASAAAADPGTDSVVGGGRHAGNVHHISAHSTSPDGGLATGSMSFKGVGTDGKPFTADVTCLLVIGDEAFVTGTITSPKDLPYTVVVANVIDRGDPGTWTDPDSIRFSWDQERLYQYVFPASAVYPDAPSECWLSWGGFFGDDTVPVTAGNMTVKNALAD